MKTITINTEKELKKFVSNNRKDITNINGVNLSTIYPILEVTNRHVSYYNVTSQANISLFAPFVLNIK